MISVAMFGRAAMGLAWVCLSFIAFEVPMAFAACTIEDVVEQIEDGLSRGEIRDECDRRVRDAGDCSLTKVMRLAKAHYDTEEIREECEEAFLDDSRPRNRSLFEDSYRERPQPRGLSNRCYSQAGPCLLFQTAPPGTPCYCNTRFGPAPGVIR